MSVTPSCHRKGIIRLACDQYTQTHAHKNTDCPLTIDVAIKNTPGVRGALSRKTGSRLKITRGRNKGNCIQMSGVGVGSDTVTCLPSLHMAEISHSWDETSLNLPLCFCQ